MGCEGDGFSEEPGTAEVYPIAVIRPLRSLPWLMSAAAMYANKTFRDTAEPTFIDLPVLQT
jgi:hypothetical protein